MDIQYSTSADALFSAISDSRANTTATLSNAALSRGIDLYQNGDYEGAVVAFKSVIGLEMNQGTDNAVNAYNYAGMAYIQLGQPDNAIKTYKAALQIDPLDDAMHIALGNVFYDQNDYANAEKEYKAAINLNSQSATNWYSLGQAYLAGNKYDEAQNAFAKVTQVSSQDYSGYYGLGQVAYKRGDNNDAIKLFNQVLGMKRDFNAAYVDLGYAYADSGDIDQARQQLKNLNYSGDTDSANLLSSYIQKVSPPEIMAAYTTGGFNVGLGPGTNLSDLDPSLSSPDSSAYFTMNFIFSKDMDATSVQNPYNWQISKAAYGTPGGAYNWGLPASSSDSFIALTPVSVVYKSDYLTAELTFQLTQNDNADGTIDPSHIIFKFNGKDAYGNAISPTADEYGGFSKIV